MPSNRPNGSAFLDHRNWHGSNDVLWGTTEGITITCKIYGLSPYLLSTSWEYHLWYDSPKWWENKFAITYWYYLVLYPEWCSRMEKKKPEILERTDLSPGCFSASVYFNVLIAIWDTSIHDTESLQSCWPLVISCFLFPHIPYNYKCN